MNFYIIIYLALQVLLKSGDEDKRDNLKHFIHQAQVNRSKVDNCILAMRRRGHRSHVHINEAKVLEKAKLLPEQGIPPELISLLPSDNSFERMRVQKAATPVEGMKDTVDEAAKAFKDERPNAVVLERSCEEEGDIQIRRESTLRTLTAKLGEKHKTENPAICKEQHDREILAKRLYDTMLLHSLIQVCSRWLQSQDLRFLLCTCRNIGNFYTLRFEATVEYKA